jgi:acetyl esterase/lipase
MCIHGGGFVSGSIYTHRKMFGHLAKATGARALLVSYHLLPEGVFPGPADDVTNAYGWLLDQGISAGRIAFAGDSVGGWLAITVQLRAREQGLPLPGDWRMAPTLANGQPAAIARYRDSAYGLGILTVTPAGIARITVFGGGPDLAAKFGFPPLFEGSLGDDGC